MSSIRRSSSQRKKRKWVSRNSKRKKPIRTIRTKKSDFSFYIRTSKNQSTLEYHCGIFYLFYSLTPFLAMNGSLTNKQIDWLIDILGVIYSSSQVLDVKSQFGHLNFPHWNDRIENSPGNLVTIFTNFMNQYKIFWNFITEQIANNAQTVRIILLFTQSRINKELVHNFTIFGGIVKVRDLKQEIFVLDLSGFRVDSIELAGPQKQLNS